MPAPAAPIQAAPTADVPLAAAAARFGSVGNVRLRDGDTASGVAQETGGQILTWDTSGCAAGDADTCAALVGLTQPSSSPRLEQVESNRDALSGGGALTAMMGGAISIWAGGAISIWAGGAISIWAGGQYQPIPQNTALWKQIGLPWAQKLAPHLGRGVTVAVIDSGIDLLHPALRDALSDPATWQDFYAGDTVPQEEGTLGTGAYGHGTNVAGIVLQIAPGARIMPLRVLGPDGSGDVAMVAQAIDWAVAHGAQVINLSLGSTEASSIIEKALKKATAKGVLVVASAGNANENRITYPAALARGDSGLSRAILSVGSVNGSDVKSSFSNYGDALELVAPGEAVYAPAPDGRMAGWSGTSMAAPMASGGLALALGERLSDKTATLPDLMATTAAYVYANSANSAYVGKLGPRGRLNLPAFLMTAGVEDAD
ncbi:serine protease [Deinococcus metalli]|nr:serine protease [Deinococcus metalli]